MTSQVTRSHRFRRVVRRKAFWGLISVPLIIAGICGWLTAPLEPPSASGTTPNLLAAPPVRAEEQLQAWPTTAMEGDTATTLLLSSLLSAQARLEAAGGYRAVFRKTERISGKVGDEQVMEMKSRLHPFSIYFKYRTPETGKEVVYAVGRYDNDIIAHGVGLSRKLIPRIKVAPESRIAMLGNRHPITDAGLAKLLDKLIHFRRLDLQDPEAVTLLDRIPNPEGGEWLRSIHTHPRQNGVRPFQRVEVLYHPEHRIPVQITSYEWPQPGDDGTLKLAERYSYDELQLDSTLTDLDFDPANPAYDFTRF